MPELINVKGKIGHVWMDKQLYYTWKDVMKAKMAIPDAIVALWCFMIFLLSQDAH